MKLKRNSTAILVALKIFYVQISVSLFETGFICALVVLKITGICLPLGARIKGMRHLANFFSLILGSHYAVMAGLDLILAALIFQALALRQQVQHLLSLLFYCNKVLKFKPDGGGAHL